MARGGRGSRGKYSANTKSYVAGKITGQYRAKGYSRARAQHIGNAVVGKNGRSFKSGRGSKKSFGKGYKIGHGQVAPVRHGSTVHHSSNIDTGEPRKTACEGANPAIAQSRRYEKRYSSNKQYGKDYGKKYR